jgi:pyridoxal biosynthesis lyase PdxS
MMQLGVDGVFVGALSLINCVQYSAPRATSFPSPAPPHFFASRAGSGIFHSGNPVLRAKAIVTAVTHYNDPKIIAEASKGLGDAMSGTGNIKTSQVSFRERGH